MGERPFWASGKLPPDYERLMAEKTHSYLTNLKRSIAVELVELGKSVEGGHERATVHDSATLLGHRNVLIGRLNMIGNLSNVFFIPPRTEVDKIFLGNTVRVWTEADNSEEIYTILGPDDATANIPNLAPDTRVISYKSPIGNALINLVVEDWVVVKVNNILVATRVLSIEPGRF